jgi:hypothetical protein
MRMLMCGHGERRGRVFIISHTCLNQCVDQDDTRDMSITTSLCETSQEVSLNNYLLSMNIDTDNQLHQYHSLRLTDSIFSIKFIFY